MGDNSTLIASNSERAPADGNGCHIADGGAEHPEKVLTDVMGRKLTMLRPNLALTPVVSSNASSLRNHG
jgi:hypothetical protein